MADLKKLLYLLTGREKRNAIVLLLLMVAGAILEVVAVSAIPAFVALLSDPARIMRLHQAQTAFAFVNAGTPEARALWGALALFVIYLIKSLYQAGLTYLQARYVVNRQRHFAERLFRAYVASPYPFHLQHNTADLLNNACVATFSISGDVLLPALRILMEAFILVAVLGLLIVIEPAVSLLTIVVFSLVLIFFLRRIRQRIAEYCNHEHEYRAALIKAANECLGGIKELKVLGREETLIGRFVDSVNMFSRAVGYKAVAFDLPRLALEAAAVLMMLVVAGSLIWLGRPLASIVPVLTLLAVAAVRVLPSANRMTASALNLRWGRPALEAVYRDIRELERLPDPSAKSVPPLTFSEEIAFQNVSFRYAGAVHDSLKDLTLRIRRGTSVGFVGPSGAGKTTAVDILLGLLQPTCGEVTVDGVSISRNLESWRQQIGYIPQSIYLTDDSIRRNVGFGIPDELIDEAKVWAAIDAAQLRELVEEQPNGLETPVGERGVRLSGGQRQRIGIARALYHNPTVLVMDEATASLDQETEREFVRALERLAGTRTIIAIAHRISTVKNCDQLLFFENGELRASGDFISLQELSSSFRSMVA
jgi:ATP-binding cassette subfamily C protein